MRRKPKIVSVMLANNETGVFQDIESLAEQPVGLAPGFTPTRYRRSGQDRGRFSSPQCGRGQCADGVGAQARRPQGGGRPGAGQALDVEPLIAGGGHERGLRSGTENVAAIVGFGVACTLAVERQATLAQICSSCVASLNAACSGWVPTLFGQAAERLPNTVYFAIPEIDGETLVGHLDRAGYAVASGAACSSANPEPSHVLRAMGVAPELARGAVRVSLGRGNNEEQVGAS
jgi:cysteine desulfurase